MSTDLRYYAEWLRAGRPRTPPVRGQNKTWKIQSKHTNYQSAAKRKAELQAWNYGCEIMYKDNVKIRRRSNDTFDVMVGSEIKN